MSLKYLALGDSYTIGESVKEEDRWPVQLINELSKLKKDVDELKIVAVTGWTTSDLLNEIRKEIFTPPYGLVSLSIGVNNQYRNENKNQFRKELTELMYQAIDFAGGDPKKVFIVSIPDWGVTSFAESRDRKQIAAEIDLFNKIKMEQCEKIGIEFVDITSISRKASLDPSLTAEDGLHPSARMYKLWVDKIITLVKEIPF
ncbi:MAG: SGNH/GDSL hydrolase family protein [Candidatus Kariarchaeaceae archaeon]|jgi:lysophospholipase L1-like esterase